MSCNDFRMYAESHMLTCCDAICMHFRSSKATAGVKLHCAPSFSLSNFDEIPLSHFCQTRRDVSCSVRPLQAAIVQYAQLVITLLEPD